MSSKLRVWECKEVRAEAGVKRKIDRSQTRSLEHDQSPHSLGCDIPSSSALVGRPVEDEAGAFAGSSAQERQPAGYPAMRMEAANVVQAASLRMSGHGMSVGMAIVGKLLEVAVTCQANKAGSQDRNVP
mgnify:FL=1